MYNDNWLQWERCISVISKESGKKDKERGLNREIAKESDRGRESDIGRESDRGRDSYIDSWWE